MTVPFRLTRNLMSIPQTLLARQGNYGTCMAPVPSRSVMNAATTKGSAIATTVNTRFPRAGGAAAKTLCTAIFSILYQPTDMLTTAVLHTHSVRSRMPLIRLMTASWVPRYLPCQPTAKQFAVSRRPVAERYSNRAMNIKEILPVVIWA